MFQNNKFGGPVFNREKLLELKVVMSVEEMQELRIKIDRTISQEEFKMAFLSMEFKHDDNACAALGEYEMVAGESTASHKLMVKIAQKYGVRYKK